MSDAPKKGLYHSEFISMPQPVTVKVIKEELESTKKKGSFYVTLEIEGRERYYNSENEQCGRAFHGLAGRTVSVCAEGRGDDARITVVGAPASQMQQPARQSAHPSQEHDSNPPGRPGGAPAVEHHTTGAGMRAGEIRYERTVGLPNYSSEKIGITVFLEEGAKAADALAYAKKFVESHLQSPSGR